MFGPTFNPASVSKTMEGWQLLNTAVPASSTRTLSPLVDGLQASPFQTKYSSACFVRNLTISTASAQPATGTMVITMFIGGVASVSVTIPAGGAGGTYANNTTIGFVPASAIVRIDCVNNANLASAQLASVTFEEDFI